MRSFYERAQRMQEFQRSVEQDRIVYRPDAPVTGKAFNCNLFVEKDCAPGIVLTLIEEAADMGGLGPVINTAKSWRCKYL